MTFPIFCSRSVLSSENPIFSFTPFSFPLLVSRTRRRRPVTLISRSRRKDRPSFHRKPPENGMSSASDSITSMPQRRDLEDDPLLDSNNSAGDGDILTKDMETDMYSTSKASSSKIKYQKSRLKLFGVDLTPDNISVAMVYFVQGVLGLSRLAVSFYLKDDLHLDPAEPIESSWTFVFPSYYTTVVLWLKFDLKNYFILGRLQP